MKIKSFSINYELSAIYFFWTRGFPSPDHSGFGFYLEAYFETIKFSLNQLEEITVLL